ncbi:hypothetical protein HWV62_21158 [Athelia sp. TMB]|nr:hypothetical protein HWV62_21158 [Athelia sp. TMB]
MYDVSSPKSLQSLTKWWKEFSELAPVREGEEEDFCCVVVGNKIDIRADNGQPLGNGSGNGAGITRTKSKWKVSEEEAASFLELLIPRSTSSPTSTVESTRDSEPELSISVTQPPTSLAAENANFESATPSSPPRARSKSESQSISIIITDNRHHAPSSLSPPSRGRGHFPTPHARSRSSTRLGYSVGTKNSLSSVATRESFYHTPSSSFYESARSSPVPFPRDGSSSSPPQDRFGASTRESKGRGRRSASTSSTSSSSALTITQSLFLRSSTSEPAPPEAHSVSQPTVQLSPTLSQPDRRPKLLFTSAKTGEGVAEVFEYVARRVVLKWEWEQRVADEQGWENGEDTIRIGLGGREGWAKRTARSCCTS